ncbi:MAG: type I DNA topoisomerase [Deltaproteobacteria bacterium]|nr:type I DNA topoisomerase [Deltaproteobacteria bacterium]
MKLFVVESPGKVKKIQGFLGPSWKVMASVGHVRDLPIKDIGVQPPDFVPQYVVTERGTRVLKELASAVKKAESVYLATDPDREGEAIAWHLEQSLHLQNARRVTYTEITEKAVQTALEQPRTIDLHLVSAQESRRVLDRLVGYLVSPVLSQQNGTRLSAGRVQSPAVRLVVERERAIRDFRVTQHYGVELSFNDPENWKAFWLPKEGGWLEENQEYLLDKNVAEQIAAIKTITVRDCQETKSKAAPPAPFVTSTLQQAASASLKISPQRCMELAQKLYENGHITYMRTDSPNLSEEAVSAIRSWAAKNNHLVPASPRVWTGKAGAQEAHEAIRPTHFEIETVNDDPEAQALYRLIRYRALASQLEDAVYALRTLRIEGEVNGKRAVFEAKGRTLLLPGWKALVARDQTEEEEDEPDMQVPQLKAGQELQVQEGKVVSKKTRPPARFTEAALVRELEKRGIGRPSTYAAILDNITHGHGYLTIEKRQLIPTDKGETVVDAMTGAFGFLDYEYTKNMEERLDAIAAGRDEYRPLVTETYAQLHQEIENYIMATSPKCPVCGKPLVHRQGVKDGRVFNFWGCSGFRDGCPAIFADDDGKPGERQDTKPKAQLSEHKCPACGKPLVHRQGEKNGREFNFWGCSGFRDGCLVTFADDDGKPGKRQDKKGKK